MWTDGRAAAYTDWSLNSRYTDVSLEYSSTFSLSSSNFSDILPALITRLGLPQPQHGKDCTVAVWNPLADRFSWISVGCNETIFINNLVCYVKKHSIISIGTLIVYVTSHKPVITKDNNQERNSYFSPTQNSIIAGFDCFQLTFIDENVQLLLSQYDKQYLQNVTSILIGCTGSTIKPISLLVYHLNASVILNMQMNYSVVNVNGSLEIAKYRCEKHMILFNKKCWPVSNSSKSFQYLRLRLFWQSAYISIDGKENVSLVAIDTIDPIQKEISSRATHYRCMDGH